jgi:hypothetical protein
LAFQLPFRFEVRSLGGSLVSSAPERPRDDVCGLNTVSSGSAYPFVKCPSLNLMGGGEPADLIVRKKLSQFVNGCICERF